MQEKYDQLISEADQLPEGDAKIAILEEAVRMADTYLDKQQCFHARMKLTRAAVYAGRGEKAILSFAWCLSEYDKSPSQYDTLNILWHYKWIVSCLMDFPEISLEKINESLEDLRSRFLSAGYNSRVYYKQKMALATLMSDDQLKEHYYKKWIAEPYDSISDCNACELSGQAFMLLSIKRYAEAEQVAAPIFQGNLKMS